MMTFRDHLFDLFTDFRHIDDLVHVILGIRPPAGKEGWARTPRIAWTRVVMIARWDEETVKGRLLRAW